jgi:hypothetical protein
VRSVRTVRSVKNERENLGIPPKKTIYKLDVNKEK